MEEWRDINGYEGLYQVSNLGRVRSLNYHREGKIRVLKPMVDRYGYLYVNLYKNGKPKSCKVHRLVAEAFIPNPYGLPCVNHKDECKTNNIVTNLEFCDVAYNNAYGTHNERSAKAMIGKHINRTDMSKRVYQYTLDGSFVRSYPSLQEAERQTGIKSVNICNCCNNKPYYNSAGNYIWSYNPPHPSAARSLW